MIWRLAVSIGARGVAHYHLDKAVKGRSVMTRDAEGTEVKAQGQSGKLARRRKARAVDACPNVSSFNEFPRRHCSALLL